MDLLQCTRDFHKKFHFPRGVAISDNLGMAHEKADGELLRIATALKTMSVMIKEAAIVQSMQGDHRLYRMHLQLEEMGESADALRQGDEVQFAHEQTDLLYVTVGTFDVFNLPMLPLFAEVHRANMTKTKKAGDYRMKDRGNSYSGPDIERVLREHGSN
jgi:predicted HAD superfamily Cof-like phosphohydrolase